MIQTPVAMIQKLTILTIERKGQRSVATIQKLTILTIESSAIKCLRFQYRIIRICTAYNIALITLTKN